MSGVRHLGFTVPFYVVQTQGQRWRTPSRGVCAECGEHRTHVYLTGDDRPYCSDCIMFDLAEASPSEEMNREQKHPSLYPIETIHERLKHIVVDDARLDIYGAIS